MTWFLTCHSIMNVINSCLERVVDVAKRVLYNRKKQELKNTLASSPPFSPECMASPVPLMFCKRTCKFTKAYETVNQELFGSIISNVI